MKKIFNVLMLLVLLMSNVLVSFSTIVEANENRFIDDDLVNYLIVSPKEIGHMGIFQVEIGFSGQSEDSSKPNFIAPGREIFIPIQTDGVANTELYSSLPNIENTEIIYNESGITIRFLEGIQDEYDISGNLKIYLRGTNDESNSNHSVDIGGQKVNISNYSSSGEKGVFAGKTGMYYPDYKSDYVTWFLRGNINADEYPGGPLIIHDELGEGQKLDGKGIEISLFWGGQREPSYTKTYYSIDEFLSSEFGSSVGSRIDYNIEKGTVDVYIPERVLNGKEFSFAYDSLITDYDLKGFRNSAEFDFYEDNQPKHISNNPEILNTLSSGEIVGKTRGYLNINKVIKGISQPVPNVKFEITRADGGTLFSGKEDTVIELITDENGQIRKSGFRPGKLIAVEIDAPSIVKFDSKDKIELDITADNKDTIFTIENNLSSVDVPVEKRWVGQAGKEAVIKLQGNGKEVSEVKLTKETDWKHVFTDLPKYDGTTGELIDYTVTEPEVDGYNTTVTGPTEEGFIVTNTITGKVSVGVTKEWVGPKAESVTIHLLANNKEIDQVDLSETNNWQHTFEKLTQYDKDGKEINYTVTEVEVSGYTTNITGDISNGFKVINTIKEEPKEEPKELPIKEKINSKKVSSSKEMNNEVRTLPKTGEKDSMISALIGFGLILLTVFPVYIRRIK